MAGPVSIAYVSCMHSREILVFALDAATGGLTQIQSVPVDGVAIARMPILIGLPLLACVAAAEPATSRAAASMKMAFFD